MIKAKLSNWVRYKIEVSVYYARHCYAFDDSRSMNVIRAGKPKDIPIVVDVYNRSMGGVDKSDQMMTSYEVERKRVKKWYKKIFNHLINQSAFNSQILHSRMGGQLTPLKFRQKLVATIIEKYSTSQPRIGQHGRRMINAFRLTERHFPSYVKSPESSTKNNNRKHQRRCTVCSKHNIHRETRFICAQCDVGLCAVPCFERYHTLANY